MGKFNIQDSAIYFNGSKFFLGKPGTDGDKMWFFSRENSFYSWVEQEKVNADFKFNNFGLAITKDVVEKGKEDKTFAGFNAEEIAFITRLYEMGEVDYSSVIRAFDAFGGMVSARLQLSDATKRFKKYEAQLIEEDQMN